MSGRPTECFFSYLPLPEGASAELDLVMVCLTTLKIQPILNRRGWSNYAVPLIRPALIRLGGQLVWKPPARQWTMKRATFEI